MTKIINLIGPSGVGKSTGAMYIASHLKMVGINAEYISEFAKILTWDERKKTLRNQALLIGEQAESLNRVIGKVDYIITDSPLILSAIYIRPEYPQSFLPFVLELFNSYNNVNYFIQRVKAFNPIGRNESEEESNRLGKTLLTYLEYHKIPFSTIAGTAKGYDEILGECVVDNQNRIDKIYQPF
jgi:ABC-type oligopeptide transport system ATPase subunit